MDHGFIDRHLEVQILRVDSPEGTPVGLKRRTCSLTGVTMHFASASTLIIPRPFVYTMEDRGMRAMTAPIALPCVGVQPRAARRKVSATRVRSRGRPPTSAARPCRARYC